MTCPPSPSSSILSSASSSSSIMSRSLSRSMSMTAEVEVIVDELKEEYLQRFVKRLGDKLPLRHSYQFYSDHEISKVAAEGICDSTELVQDLANRGVSADIVCEVNQDFQADVSRVVQDFLAKNHDQKVNYETLTDPLIETSCKLYETSAEAYLSLNPETEEFFQDLESRRLNAVSSLKWVQGQQKLKLEGKLDEIMEKFKRRARAKATGIGDGDEANSNVGSMASISTDEAIGASASSVGEEEGEREGDDDDENAVETKYIVNNSFGSMSTEEEEAVGAKISALEGDENDDDDGSVLETKGIANNSFGSMSTEVAAGTNNCSLEGDEDDDEQEDHFEIERIGDDEEENGSPGNITKDEAVGMSRSRSTSSIADDEGRGSDEGSKTPSQLNDLVGMPTLSPVIDIDPSDRGDESELEIQIRSCSSLSHDASANSSVADPLLIDLDDDDNDSANNEDEQINIMDDEDDDDKGDGAYWSDGGSDSDNDSCFSEPIAPPYSPMSVAGNSENVEVEEENEELSPEEAEALLAQQNQNQIPPEINNDESKENDVARKRRNDANDIQIILIKRMKHEKINEENLPPHIIVVERRGNKPLFRCSLCNNPEPFKTKDHVRYHRYCHKKQKDYPFGCDECQVRFKNHQRFRVHRRTQHRNFVTTI